MTAKNLTNTYQIAGRTFECDERTFAVLNDITPSAIENNDPSAVAFLLGLAVKAGRAVEVTE